MWLNTSHFAGISFKKSELFLLIKKIEKHKSLLILRICIENVDKWQVYKAETLGSHIIFSALAGLVVHWGFALLTVKLEWTVSDIISKDSAPFYEPYALKIDLFATAVKV